MQTILLVIHLLLAVALIGIILIQRNESGALGGLGGGGSGGGGFMTRRGSANFLTRTTAVLAAAFIGTSLALAILSGRAPSSDSVIETMGAETPAEEASQDQPQAPQSSSGSSEPTVPVDE